MEKRMGQVLLLLFLCTGSFAQQEDTTSIKVDASTYHLNNNFSSFSLQLKDSKKVLLQWAIQSAVASDYFSIERNVDGKNFETIGVIKSHPASNNYEFTDEIPTRGNSLYRIRMTDKKGESVYSDSSPINIPGSSFISFYPNPMDNVLIIRCAFAAELAITDALGKARVTRTIGVGPTVIDVSTLEKGVYLLRISDKSNGQQQVEKIIKN
jgi:hypothetical protein